MRRKKDNSAQTPVAPQVQVPIPVEEIPRFCPDCGAANTSNGLRCTICGHQFASNSTVAQFWENQTRQPNGFESFGALYEAAPSMLSYEEEEDDDLSVTRPYAPVVDPWSSSGGRLGAEPGDPDAFVPPSGKGKKRRRTGGPPGWLLGLFGLLLIGGVAAATLALVVRPLVADRIESASSDAIVEALAQATIVPDLTAGTVVVAEQQVNRSLRANADSYRPIQSPRIQIRRSGFVITFTLYRYDGTLTGDLEVEDGRIVIRDPKIDGIADRLIDTDKVARQAETAINNLLARNNLQAIAVILADDTLTITTQPAQQP